MQRIERVSATLIINWGLFCVWRTHLTWSKKRSWLGHKIVPEFILTYHLLTMILLLVDIKIWKMPWNLNFPRILTNKISSIQLDISLLPWNYNPWFWTCESDEEDVTKCWSYFLLFFFLPHCNTGREDEGAMKKMMKKHLFHFFLFRPFGWSHESSIIWVICRCRNVCYGAVCKWPRKNLRID